MDKIKIVASTEFATAVRTKAFLVGILLLPILMGGSILLQTVVADRVDTKPRRFAVIDYSGSIFPSIDAASKVMNDLGSGKLKSDDPQVKAMMSRRGRSTWPPFIPSLVRPSGQSPDELRLELSERIRKGELFAFVEIPANLVGSSEKSAAKILYHTENPNDDALERFLDTTINAYVRVRRFQTAGIDPLAAERLSQPVPTEVLGLLTRGSDGRIRPAEKVDRVRTFVVPAVLMFVVFMVVMTTTPQLLNSVIEEKMSKISEVMLGSVSPFELMMGKLIGNIGIALVLAVLYVLGGWAAAAYYGYADAVSPTDMLALALFLTLAVVLFGSLYMAVGSACSELKDAQSLMMPVLLLAMLPAFCWTIILNNPSSPTSVGLSLFPPATPFLMFMRMLLKPSPPAWQVALSIVLTSLTTLGCVWCAAKIFRTGILMQGKTASFGEMARWVLAK
jgi:ABC-2 type transport system permease protein